MNEYADLTYHQKKREVILNKAKDYYENDKERSREQASRKYRNLFEEEKNKIVSSLRFNSLCYLFRCTLLNFYINAILDKLTEIKA